MNEETETRKDINGKERNYLNLHNYLSEAKWYGGTSMGLQVRKPSFRIFNFPTYGSLGFNSLTFRTSQLSFFLINFYG